MAALLFIVVLGQLDAGEVDVEVIPAPMTPEPVDAGAPPAVVHRASPVPAPSPEPETPRAPAFAMRAGIETGVLLFPEGNPFDGLAVARPLLSFEAGELFAAELGATFNLLILDTTPYNSGRELGGILRKPDWDEPSDFGQILRHLRIGSDGGPAWLRAGAVRLKTLGNGHVINRYSNQDNPNYHPASANGGLHVGPFRAELFASDVLGPRILGGLVGVELGRIIANDPKWHDRFWVTAELAHDFGNAGGAECPPASTDASCPAGARRTTPGVTVLEADFSAMVARTQTAKLQLLAGLGGGFASGRGDLGALAGMTGELDVGPVSFGAKVEARKQGGVFRHGLFGPQYEISRFAAAGFSGPLLAQQLLPDSGSVYGELRVGSRGLVIAEVAIEHFFWNRTDVDVTLQAELFGSRVVTLARFTAVAVGVLPRYAATGEVRVRFIPSLYVVASGGTVFFPQADASLTRGVFFMGGAGVDLEVVTKR
ncbi:MAG: hypothetical protein JNK82_13775 [Myxococcaceae bacterium]|nr:hypothetical protein [Myxococcaceae bacterium]